MSFNLEEFEMNLATLVNIDSGSLCREGVNRVADWFEERFRARGWPVLTVAREPTKYGRSLYTWVGDPEHLDLLILSHTDTVFPEGTAVARPFRKEDDFYFGPGVADMKAGCLMADSALDQLQRSGRLSGSVGFFLNGEHELSCPTIRPFIEKISRQAKLVVSTEPARADGSCVRERKGILRYQVHSYGRSAHSGVDPQNGACANTELARLILHVKQLENPSRGIFVNPGLIKGGSSINVISAAAECQIDIRVPTLEDGYAIDGQLRAYVSSVGNDRTRLELSGGITRPPLVPHPVADRMIGKLNELARHYGVELSWTHSGGGSDASFASGLGIPALCGLGPVGGHYHTDQEYVRRVDLQERLCIFRDMVAGVCTGDLP